MTDHDNNAVPTLTQRDRDQLDHLVETVQDELGMAVHVMHTDYDRGQITFQLHDHAMDEWSQWARAVHHLRDEGYSPQEVQSMVFEHAEIFDDVDEDTSAEDVAAAAVRATRDE